VTPVLSAAGVVTHFVGWLLDLSEREAAQRGEREATALLVQCDGSDHRRESWRSASIAGSPI